MDGITISQAATWGIAALATCGVIVRPWGFPEAIWVVLGASALVVLALLPWHDALAAIGKGTDVYFFLTGMMLLAELARREGLFDWLAAHAAEAAKGSPARLFSLVYIVGIAGPGDRLVALRRHGRAPNRHGDQGRQICLCISDITS